MARDSRLLTPRTVVTPGNQVTITPLAAMTISLSSLPQLNMGFINVFRVTISFLCTRRVTGIHINNPIFCFVLLLFFNNDCDGF